MRELKALYSKSVGWHRAALLQMCLLLIVPIMAMLFFDLGKTLQDETSSLSDAGHNA
jgi:hypothetical protein